jgi:hypothetical protein
VRPAGGGGRTPADCLDRLLQRRSHHRKPTQSDHSLSPPPPPSHTQGEAVAESWLRALQLAQIAFDRLLFDLAQAQRNLSFWRGRLRAGSHGAFMMLARGPSAFVNDALAALGLRAAGAAAGDQIEQRVRPHGGAGCGRMRGVWSVWLHGGLDVACCCGCSAALVPDSCRAYTHLSIPPPCPP